MQPRKLAVAFAFFPYGGNGGFQSEHPCIRKWFARTLMSARHDTRISDVFEFDISDTPITMTRNQAVLEARKIGADVLVMVDSDQAPDLYLGEPGAVPFFESSFDYIYKHWDKGPVVIGSPYCGPPVEVENVYVFRWINDISSTPDDQWRLGAYTRHEAAIMSGIQECAALPTGLIMFDMRAFELTEPKADGDKPWFYYEWKDRYAAEKSSTEDVTATRDMGLIGQEVLGYNPVLCNWSAWAGHHKPKCVGKPLMITATHVGEKLRRASISKIEANDRLVSLKGLKPDMKQPVEIVDLPASPPRSKYWLADSAITDYVTSLIPEGARVLEVGPGKYPFERADVFVDWGCRHDDERYLHIDVSREPLPFPDKSFDFVYCRHTIEDLADPTLLLSEMSRVAKAGYIETPSPIAECTTDVDACDGAEWRGYHHHHWIVASDGKTLTLIPKLPLIEHIPFGGDGWQFLGEGPVHWNTFHLWSDSLDFKVLLHERDFQANENYGETINKLVSQSLASCVDFYNKAAAMDKPKGDLTLPAGLHTPDRDLAALTDLVSSVAERNPNRPLRIAEVGCWVGQSALAIHAGFGIAGGHIDCVDTWKGTSGDVTGLVHEIRNGEFRQLDTFHKNTREIQDHITAFEGTSIEAAKQFDYEGRQFDLVFIDADHSYEATKADIDAWLPLVRVGGVICGHDYGIARYPGVRKAVDESLRGVQTTGGCMWWTRVTRQELVC